MFATYSRLDSHIRTSRDATEQLTIARATRHSRCGEHGLGNKTHDFQGRLLHRRPGHSMVFRRAFVRRVPGVLGSTARGPPTEAVGNSLVWEAGAIGRP